LTQDRSSGFGTPVFISPKNDWTSSFSFYASVSVFGVPLNLDGYPNSKDFMGIIYLKHAPFQLLFYFFQKNLHMALIRKFRNIVVSNFGILGFFDKREQKYGRLVPARWGNQPQKE